MIGPTNFPETPGSGLSIRPHILYNGQSVNFFRKIVISNIELPVHHSLPNKLIFNTNCFAFRIPL